MSGEDDVVHFRERETGKIEIKVNILGRQEGELLREKLDVPALIQSKLIVCQNIGPFLILVHMLNANTGNFGEPELLGGCHATVARQDRSALINQHRVGKPELLDARSDLIDLVSRCVRALVFQGEREGMRRISVRRVGTGVPFGGTVMMTLLPIVCPQAVMNSVLKRARWTARIDYWVLRGGNC